MEITQMKPNWITYTALIALLFGLAAAPPCLPLQQGEKHEKDRGEQSNKTQTEPRLHEAQQSESQSQQPHQTKALSPILAPHQQSQPGDRGQQERAPQL